ncbi:4Fe-4S cluster-binding domain-containing protein [Prevotella koreensis]|uniref:radical SAM protein n=1 Tax=Prevotella koreensis TaxID=2490854 RepID=UPI0028EC6A00|nr:4Fe-4S cluster-binding domain-containing protein [Prevotella koreensis]
MDICISTNRDCNLHCIYCFEKNKSKEVFDVSNCSKKLKDLLKSEPVKRHTIKLHGGEPFLVFSEIKEFCEEIWKEFPNVVFRTTTNGTLIHGEIQAWLKRNENQFKIKLSIDGCKEAQDINRPNSFNLIDIPFFSSELHDVVVNLTITPKTLYLLCKSITFLHESGFQNIRPNFQELANWDKYENLKEFYNQLVQLKSYYLLNPQYKVSKLFDIHFERVKDDSEFYYPCTIGTKMAFDIVHEKSYPCHWFFENVVDNNILSRIEDMDFSNPLLLLSKECKVCSFVNICHTCYIANYIQRGSVKLRDKGMCKLQKIQFSVVAEYQYQCKSSHKHSYQISHMEKYLKKLRKEVDIILKRNTDNGYTLF